MRYLSLLGFLVLSGLPGSFIFADGTSEASSIEQAIAQKIKQAVPHIPIVSVSSSDFAGIYDVTLANGEHLFASADGGAFIAGDMYQVNPDGLVNLTENIRSKNRSDKLAAISDNDKIIFSPETKKVSVTVFTDIDCGYCRKLHMEMPGYLAKGIEVKYVAFPRAGVGSPSFDKIVSAWCADDKNSAMTQLKSGKSIPVKTCDNPVATQYRLGQEIGIRGTPAIVLESGELLSGYYPPDKLAEILKL